MKKFIFMLIVLIAFPAFAANKNKQKKEEIVEDWYVYKYQSQNGSRSPFTSKCEKSNRSPAEQIEWLEKARKEYNIVEHVIRNGKPVVVDILTYFVMSGSGYDYAYRTDYEYASRYIKGEKFCNEYREDDVSGKLNKNRIDRYK